MSKLMFEFEDGWKIYCEKDNIVHSLFKDDRLFCICPSKQNCNDIVSGIRFSKNMENSKRHDEMIIKDFHDRLREAIFNENEENCGDEMNSEACQSYEGKCAVCKFDCAVKEINK